MAEIPYEYQKPNISQEAIDKVNQACYDNRADYWDRFPFPDALPGLIKKYYNPDLGNRVLDIGSGTGMLAKWLSDQNFNVLCIDPSAEMVKRCQEKGLTTLQTTFQNYHGDSKFSMIFAILSMIHVPKAEFSTQLKKIADSMPQGGLLFLGMIEGSGEGFFEQSDYPRFFAYYTPKEIEAIAQKYFLKVDYHYSKSGQIGYMLFVFKKI